MAEASGLGVTVYADRIRVSRETEVLCGLMGVNPLGTFASGSLLIAIDPAGVEEASKRLDGAGIPVSVIGVMGPAGGRWVERKRGREPLPVFHQDELSRILG